MKLVVNKEDLFRIVKDSLSYAEVLRKLDINISGTSHRKIKFLIDYYEYDISHFLHQSFNKSKKGIHRRNIDEYLSNSIKISSWKLKKRLFESGLAEEKCSMCGLTEWLGNKIPLELDHIDGNKLNNNLSNLRILCPNCHYFTPTYKIKNRKDIKNIKAQVV